LYLGDTSTESQLSCVFLNLTNLRQTTAATVQIFT
jgi:hypothetical protein